MCTAQSSRPGIENSQVPYTGPTIHTRSAYNTGQVVDGFLAEYGVTGPLVAQSLEDQRVRLLVTRVAQIVRIVETDFLARCRQQFTGVPGHLGGQRRIGQAHRSSIRATVEVALGGPRGRVDCPA
jgi:hypothetical protein